MPPQLIVGFNRYREARGLRLVDSIVRIEVVSIKI